MVKKARIDKMVSLRLSKKDSATIDEIRNRLAEPLAALGIKATRHAAMKHALLVGLALFEEDLEEFKRRYVRSAHLSTTIRERDEARDWVRRLTREQRVLTCAFCGEAYPPGTPESNDGALLAHVKVCAKHPMRGVETRVVELEQLLADRTAGYREMQKAWDETIRDRDEARAKLEAAEALIKAKDIHVGMLDLVSAADDDARKAESRAKAAEVEVRRLEGVLLETSNERAVQWQRYTRLHDNLQILRDRVTQAQRERDEAVSEARRYLDERDEAMRIAAQNLAGAEDASKYVAELEAEVERLRARVHSDICGTVCVCGQDARAEVTDADA